MIVHTRYLGKIREIVKKDSESFVFKGKDVEDFLKFLYKKYGKKLKTHMEEKNQVGEDYAILVCGVNIEDNLKREIKDGDDIIFMPLVIGG